MSGRRSAARYAAPVAFLAAVTVAVLLIRSGLDGPESRVQPPAVQTRAPTPEPAATTSAQTATAPATTAPATTAPAEGKRYEIQAGDTLDKVAQQFGTTVEQLLVLNPDVDPVALRIGQTIRVE